MQDRIKPSYHIEYIVGEAYPIHYLGNVPVQQMTHYANSLLPNTIHNISLHQVASDVLLPTEEAQWWRLSLKLYFSESKTSTTLRPEHVQKIMYFDGSFLVACGRKITWKP